MLYKWLGGLSITFLATAIALSVFILTGRHSRKATYVVSGTVLFLMLTVTVLCSIIYARYG